MPSAPAIRPSGADMDRHADEALSPGHLLVTDVDGTLLTRDYRLLPEVGEAVRHARAHGVAVMLATARGPAALKVVLRDLGPVDYAICFGGALVLERIGQTWAPALPDRVALAVGDIVRVRDAAGALGIAIGAYTEHGVHIGAADAWFERELAHTGEPLSVIPFDKIAEPVFKLLAITDRAEAARLEALRAALPEALESVYSHPNYLEIMVRGVSKGRALERFCAARGLDRAQVVAAGDSDNDVSLFRSAGHSAAMPDSSPAAREAAGWVASADRGAGLAAVIEHYATSLWRIPAPPNPINWSEKDGQ